MGLSNLETDYLLERSGGMKSERSDRESVPCINPNNKEGETAYVDKTGLAILFGSGGNSHWTFDFTGSENGSVAVFRNLI